jgi:hypothetical protein
MERNLTYLLPETFLYRNRKSPSSVRHAGIQLRPLRSA